MPKSKDIASVAVFNLQGQLLFIKRRDSKLFCLTGGHFEDSEEPEHAARRELLEEANITPITLAYMGDGTGGKNHNLRIYCFRATTDQIPSSKNDPDDEAESFHFVDVSQGLPPEIASALHNQVDITLRLLGLQEPVAKAEPIEHDDVIEHLKTAQSPDDLVQKIKALGDHQKKTVFDFIAQQNHQISKTKTGDPNAKLLYHGTPHYDKIMTEGFKLTNGQRSHGFMGAGYTVPNQGVFLNENKQMADYFGQNRAEHPSDAKVIPAYASLGNVADMARLPSHLNRLGVDLVNKYSGTKKGRLAQSDYFWLLDQQPFVDAVKGAGFHSVRFPETRNVNKLAGTVPQVSNTYMVFDPQRVVPHREHLRTAEDLFNHLKQGLAKAENTGSDGVTHVVQANGDEDWYKNGKLHRDNGPASSFSDQYGSKIQSWYQHGQLHRDNGPAQTIDGPDETGGLHHKERWFQNGKAHRLDGPAYTDDVLGQDYHHEVWLKEGKKHRDGGPAQTTYYGPNQGGTELWYRDGLLHREDGPATTDTDADGTQTHGYYLNGKKHNLKPGTPLEVRLNTNKLRQLRDHIQAKGGVVGRKDLPQQLPEELKPLLGPKGELTADKLQSVIDSKPGLKFEVTHSAWNGAQRHNENQNSNVFQLNVPPEKIDEMKQAGVHGTFENMMEASRQSAHPVQDNTIGWVRWNKPASKEAAIEQAKERALENLKASKGIHTTPDGLSHYIGTEHPRAQQDAYVQSKMDEAAAQHDKQGAPSIFMDEVQSDFGQSFGKKVAEEARRKAEEEIEGIAADERRPPIVEIGGEGYQVHSDSPDNIKQAYIDSQIADARRLAEQKWPEAHQQKINQILFGGKHPNEVLHEAFHEWARQNGHVGTPISVWSPESKGRISLGDQDKAIPGHMMLTYGQVPQKMGMKPDLYGNRSAENNPKLAAPFDYRPVYADVVRKKEDLEKGAMQRLAPFNPLDVPADDRKPVQKWLSVGDKNYRDKITEMPAEAKARALHRLHAQTLVRKNPQTGQREFLLHRGMSPYEHQKGHGHKDGEFQTADLTSWTPKHDIASNFANDYQHRASPDHLSRAPVVSAWVPEQAIVHKPSQIGNQHTAHVMGPAEYQPEQEHIVAPGKFQLATPEEIKQAKLHTLGPEERFAVERKEFAEKLRQNRSRQYQSKYMADWAAAGDKLNALGLSGKKLNISAALKSEHLQKTPVEWNPSSVFVQHNLQHPVSSQSGSDNYVQSAEIAPNLHVHKFSSDPSPAGKYTQYLLTNSAKPPQPTDKPMGIIAGTDYTRYREDPLHRKPFKIHLSAIDPKFRGKGLGKLLYSHVARDNGQVESDAMISPEASHVYEALRADPKLNVKLGDKTDETRHKITYLGKSLKHQFMALAASSALAATPTSAEVAPKLHAPAPSVKPQDRAWHPQGLHEELYPIAHLESSFGKKLNHIKNSKGDFHSAFGAVGMKPITAYEEYQKQPHLKTLYPGLDDKEKFTQEFKSNPTFYNASATAHWNHLKRVFGTPERSAYAWRWGQGAAHETDDATIKSDPYVVAFGHLYAKLHPQELSKAMRLEHYSHSPDLHTLDPKFQGTGQAGAERNRPDRIPRVYAYQAGAKPESQFAGANKYVGEIPASFKLYDMSKDHLGLLKPKIKRTSQGTVYEAAQLDQVERKIRNLGYAGYRGYHPSIPGAVALFGKLPVKKVS